MRNIFVGIEVLTHSTNCAVSIVNMKYVRIRTYTHLYEYLTLTRFGVRNTFSRTAYYSAQVRESTKNNSFLRVFAGLKRAYALDYEIFN